MAVTVRLDRKTEDWLRTAARRRGVTRSEVIREALRAQANKEQEDGEGPTAYERWKDVIGIEKGGPTDLSVRTGEKYAQALRERRRAR